MLPDKLPVPLPVKEAAAQIQIQTTHLIHQPRATRCFVYFQNMTSSDLAAGARLPGSWPRAKPPWLPSQMRRWRTETRTPAEWYLCCPESAHVEHGGGGGRGGGLKLPCATPEDSFFFGLAQPLHKLVRCLNDVPSHRCTKNLTGWGGGGVWKIICSILKRPPLRFHVNSGGMFFKQGYPFSWVHGHSGGLNRFCAGSKYRSQVF